MASSRRECCRFADEEGLRNECFEVVNQVDSS